MKTIELLCKNCGESFDRELKEYKRQTKHGRTNFFCSRRCTGLYNTDNLPNPSTNPWCLDKTHLQKMSILAKEKNIKYTKEEYPFYQLLRKTQKRYEKENDLTISYLKELWEKQKGRCAITNIPLNLKGKNYNTNASIDRISSAVGYLKENVQIVCTTMNLAKCHSSNDDALEFIRLIRENA